MRFTLKNRQLADMAPLQVYSSGLMFTPRNSVIRELYNNELSCWSQLPKVEESWSANIQTLEGHSGTVTSVAFCSDGRLLASGSYDSTIKLWDPNTGELRQTLKEHSNWVWPENSPGMSILEEKWLCLHSEKILWLAKEYRPSCLAVNGGILALGHASGRVSFLSPCVL